MRCDVVVVGAGISGLCSAAELTRRGLRVVVVEARNAAGGRIRTHRPADGGPFLELGAQVIHGADNPLRTRLSGRATAGPVPRPAIARMTRAGSLLPLRVLERDGTAPWCLEGRLAAAGARDEPVACWLHAQGLPPGQVRAASEWFRQNWSAEPTRLSALGVTRARRGERWGAGEFALADGFSSLVDASAAGLDLRLGQPARRLAWAPGHVGLTVAEYTVTARAAVVTVPPAVVADDRLEITPLPAAKASAAAALRGGDGWCAVVTLSRPAPESASVFDADGRTGFIRCTAGRPEVLVVAKSAAARYARAAHPGALIARALPWSAASRPVAVRVADWGADPWSAGAFSYPAVGALWAGPAWARPLAGTVFFAGEATTAGSRSPSVHGALDSGLRAAREVMEAFNDGRTT
jgi:monoamine oxidase